MTSPPKLLAMMAIALVPAPACDAWEPTLGSVSVSMTALAGESVEAWITISGLYLQTAPPEHDPPAARVHLVEEAGLAIDLAGLVGGTAELVSAAAVPTGSYEQLRLAIAGGCVVTAAGEVFASSADYLECGERTGTLMIPTGSGVRVDMPALTVAMADRAVELELDLAESYGQLISGDSIRWVLTPVVRGT